MKNTTTADGPRDAMCISGNLVNCCATTIGTSCTTNREQIEAIEIGGYSRLTCDELHVCVQRLRAIHKLDRRRFLSTTPSTCHGEIFEVQSLE